MAEISRFYGIKISMYPNDHNPPHFHARHGLSMASVDIHTGRVTQGALPPTAQKLVRQWAMLHERALLDNWTRIAAGEPPLPIAPLD